MGSDSAPICAYQSGYHFWKFNVCGIEINSWACEDNLMSLNFVWQALVYNDLLQKRSRFTFILLFCSLSKIKMYKHSLQRHGRVALPVEYWIYGWRWWVLLLEENYSHITTIDSQQATVRLSLICHIGIFAFKKAQITIGTIRNMLRHTVALRFWRALLASVLYGTEAHKAQKIIGDTVKRSWMVTLIKLLK